MHGVLSDPDFPSVAQQLGLMDYWRTTHIKPAACATRNPTFARRSESYSEKERFGSLFWRSNSRSTAKTYLGSDERGGSYARVVGAAADIGAFEFDANHSSGSGFESQ